MRTRTLTFYLAPFSLILSNREITISNLQLQLWTVLYPSKGGPLSNMFLCYLRSPGHNRKMRTSSFGKCVLVSLVIYTHTSSFSGIYKCTPTYPGVWIEALCKFWFFFKSTHFVAISVTQAPPAEINPAHAVYPYIPFCIHTTPHKLIHYITHPYY